MEISLDREEERGGQFYPASSALARGNKRVSHMNGSVLFEDPRLFKEQSHAVIVHTAQGLTHSQVAQPTFTLSRECVSFTLSHLASMNGLMLPFTNLHIQQAKRKVEHIINKLASFN